MYRSFGATPLWLPTNKGRRGNARNSEYNTVFIRIRVSWAATLSALDMRQPKEVLPKSCDSPFHLCNRQVHSSADTLCKQTKLLLFIIISSCATSAQWGGIWLFCCGAQDPVHYILRVQFASRVYILLALEWRQCLFPNSFLWSSPVIIFDSPDERHWTASRKSCTRTSRLWNGTCSCVPTVLSRVAFSITFLC